MLITLVIRHKRMGKVKELKQLARSALKGRYWEAVLAYAILCLPSLIEIVQKIYFTVALIIERGFGFYLYTTTVVNTPKVINILSFLYLLWTVTFLLGYNSYNLKLIKNEPASVTNLFDYTKFYIETIWLGLNIFWKAFLWSIGSWVTLFLISWGFHITPYITLLGLIIPLIMMLPYLLSNYVIVENPYLSVQELFQESARLMEGNKWNFILLLLSFIGWFILGYLTFGLVNILVAPYLSASLAAFYLDTKESHPITTILE